MTDLRLTAQQFSKDIFLPPSLAAFYRFLFVARVFVSCQDIF